MKAPEWKKTALLVTNDIDVRNRIMSAFGHQTILLVHEDAQSAGNFLLENLIDILIIDTKTTEPETKQPHAQSPAVFVELCQAANQTNPGLTIIILSVKVMMQNGLFAEKSGATLIMDRHNISINLMTYVIRILRKRTFRKFLVRDLPLETAAPVDIYHYLPMNNSYLRLMKVGKPFTEHIHKKLLKNNIRHLYVTEKDQDSLIRDLKKLSSNPCMTEDLIHVREGLRQLLISFFNSSTDAHLAHGKKMLEDGLAIIANIDLLIKRYPNPLSALKELPSQRWSAMSHSINCAIYALIFSQVISLQSSREVALAAMLHNLGLSHIDQNILLKKESDFTAEELAVYKAHPAKSLEMIKHKSMPSTPMMDHAILHHHENWDASGFPEGLASVDIPIETALLSIVGSFDYFNTVRTGEKSKSLQEAWLALEEFQSTSTPYKKKFDPELLEIIKKFISA